MAQNRMTHQALIDQLQGADTDVLRRVLEHAMQPLIEAEAATQIGAGPHERAAGCVKHQADAPHTVKHLLDPRCQVPAGLLQRRDAAKL